MTATATVINDRPLLAPMHLPFLHLLFAISGACALIYQLAWVRYFALEFGSTTLAIATVIAVFMGGLAIGAVWGGRKGGSWDPEESLQ